LPASLSQGDRLRVVYFLYALEITYMSCSPLSKARRNGFLLIQQGDSHGKRKAPRFAVQLKKMREAVEAIEANIRNAKTDMLASAGPPDQATCVRCGAGPLTQYLTSRDTGATYCPECAGRMEECK